MLKKDKINAIILLACTNFAEFSAVVIISGVVVVFTLGVDVSVGVADPADVVIVEPVDTVLVDIADIVVVKPADAGVVDPADVVIVEPANTVLVDTADVVIVEPADTVLVDTADIVVVKPVDAGVVYSVVISDVVESFDVLIGVVDKSMDVESVCAKYFKND